MKVTDKNGAAVTKSFTVKITSAKLSTSGSFSSGFLGEAYTGSIKVSGGTAPYTWKKASGTLPAGLKLKTTSTGTTLKLTGTPSKAGDYSFKITATDAKGLSITKSFIVIIEDEDFEDEDFEIDGAAMPKTTGTKNLSDKSVSVIEEASEFVKNFSVATTELKVSSDDILWQGEGRDEDLIDVKAGKPINFVIGEWVDFNGKKVEVFDAKVYINDELADDIVISEENTFTIPAEVIGGDFRIYVKAQSNDGEILSEELFISIIQ